MMPPRRTKRKQSGSLAEQVLSKRNKQTNIHESASENQSGSSSANVVISDSQLNSLADILLKKFQERGVAPCQNASQTSNESAELAVVSTTESVRMPVPATVSVTSTETITTNTIQNVSPAESTPATTVTTDMVQDVLTGEAFPKLVLPVGKCVSYDLTLGALIPEKLKNQIWDNKYVDLWHIYRVIAMGENKQDISLNISKQGTSTVVNLQQKDQQRAMLSISQWITAFHTFMDVYIMKHPEDAAGLLTYINLIRDLDRSHGTKAFNFYGRTFRSHRETQLLPWGRMHPELWIRASSLTNNQASASTAQICFHYNKPQGCSFPKCNFAHVCSYCKKTHPRFNCFALKAQPKPDSQPNSSLSHSRSNISQGKNKPNTTGNLNQTAVSQSQPFRGSR